MSNSIKGFVALALVAIVSACGSAEEETVYIEEPVVMEEPTTKY